MRWAIEVQKPRSLSETLAELDSFLYSTIGGMRRIKIYLRSTMKNERLSSIGILHIHRSKRVNIEGIIDEFAGAVNRRLAFAFNDDS